MSLSKQRQGELFIFGELLLWSLFPIITVLSYNTLSPLISLALSSFFSILFFTVLMAKRKLWHEIVNHAAYKNILLASFLLGVIYYLLTFLGLHYTTPGNMSLLALTQVFFNFLFFHVFRREHIPTNHIWGALLLIGGVCIILGKNIHTFNLGDIIIVLATMFAPLGNFYIQKARKQVSSETIMFFRSLISTVVIFLFAITIKTPISLPSIQSSLPFLIINGVLLLGLSKILWIEGIHRISVTKASALSSGTSPFLTLFFAWLILQQAPTIWQLLSIFPIVIGVILLSKTKTTIPSLPKGN